MQHCTAAGSIVESRSIKSFQELKMTISTQQDTDNNTFIRETV